MPYHPRCVPQAPAFNRHILARFGVGLVSASKKSRAAATFIRYRAITGESSTLTGTEELSRLELRRELHLSHITAATSL